MNFRNLLIGTIAVLSLAACSKSSDNNRGTAAVGAPALVDSNNVDSYQAGTPNYTFGVQSGQLSVDGAKIDHIDDATFAGYSMLSSQVAQLSALNQVIQTKENTLELWSAGSLALAFDLRTDSPTLLHDSSGAFVFDHVSYTMNAGEQGQGLSSATLTIDMRECLVDQGKQEQGQDQGKEQGKVVPIDQGKKLLLADDVVGEGQGQGQGQEQGKEETKPVDQGKAPEVCKTASMTFLLAEIAAPKQEQGQDQGKEQGQDQGKVVPIDQGKEQGQDQGKVVPIDQGKEQGQDQGKVVPIDQGKEQGQDQGKVAPIDQGKEQGQDQGKVAPIDQGKEQGQDQGKVAPIDQGKEQGQDQGKVAPIDQGKK